MLRSSVHIVCTMNQEYRDPQPCSRNGRTDSGDVEMSAFFGQPERPRNNWTEQEARCPLCRDRPKIGERFRRDHAHHALVAHRALNRYGATQRIAHQYDRPRRQHVDDAFQIAILVKAICAHAAIGLPMRATVIGDDVEATLRDPLDDTDRTRSMVGDAMQIDETLPPRSACGAAPSAQHQPVAGVLLLDASLRRGAIERDTRWMKQPTRGYRGHHGESERNQEKRHAQGDASEHSSHPHVGCDEWIRKLGRLDRKSTRLNSSHLGTSYSVFCFK